MFNPNQVPTVRVKSGAERSFVVINAADFDHDEHELFDDTDAGLVPARAAKVVAAEAENIAALQKLLGEAEDRAMEAESERDEMKARAEAAEDRAAKAEAALADESAGELKEEVAKGSE